MTCQFDCKKNAVNFHPLCVFQLSVSLFARLSIFQLHFAHTRRFCRKRSYNTQCHGYKFHITKRY
jgi:hypothetical protein